MVCAQGLSNMFLPQTPHVSTVHCETEFIRKLRNKISLTQQSRILESLACFVARVWLVQMTRTVARVAKQAPAQRHQDTHPESFVIQ